MHITTKFFFYFLLNIVVSSCSWKDLPPKIGLKSCAIPTNLIATPNATNFREYTFSLSGTIATDIVYPITWKQGSTQLGTSTSNAFTSSFINDGTYNITAEVTTVCGDKKTVVSSITVKTPAILSANKFSLTDPTVHAGLVAVAVTNDGTVIANEYNSIKIWNWRSKSLLRTLNGHSTNVSNLKLSMDEKYLFSCSSSENSIIVWDWKNNTIIRTLTGHISGVFSLAVSADNKYLVSSSNDKTIKIWEIATGNLIRTITNDEVIYFLAICNDAKYVAGSNSSSTSKLKVWDVSNGNLLSIYQETGTSYSFMAFSPDGSRLFTRQFKNSPYFLGIKVYKTETQTLLKEINTSTPGAGLTISPDGKYCLFGNHFIDASNYTILWTKFNNLSNFSSSDCSMSANSSYGVQWLAGNIVLMNAGTGEAYSNSLSKSQSYITSAVILPSKNQLIVKPAPFEIFSLDLQGTEKFINGSDTRGYVTLSTGSNYYASHACDKVNIWQIDNGNLFKQIKANPLYCSGLIAMSTNDSFIAVDERASGGKNIEIYDISTGSKLRTLSGHTNIISSLRISPDNKYIITYSTNEKNVKIWDVNTGINTQSIVTTSSNYYSSNLSISADSKLVAITDGGFIKIHIMSSGTLVNSINNSGFGYSNLAFSADGKYLAGSYRNNGNSKIRIWNVSDGSVYRESTISINPVELSFNTTGSQLYVVTEKDFQVLNIN